MRLCCTLRAVYRAGTGHPSACQSQSGGVSELRLCSMGRSETGLRAAFCLPVLLQGKVQWRWGCAGRGWGSGRRCAWALGGGRAESLALLPCPPAKPSALLAARAHVLQAGPGAEQSDRAAVRPLHAVRPGEHPATVGPGCRRSQGLVSRSIASWGSKYLLPLLCRCPALAQILLCLTWGAGDCCGRRQGAAGPALLCRAGCRLWAGRPAACLSSGTGLTSSLGPWLVLCPDGAGLAGACWPLAALSFG